MSNLDLKLRFFCFDSRQREAEQFSLLLVNTTSLFYRVCIGVAFAWIGLCAPSQECFFS